MTSRPFSFVSCVLVTLLHSFLLLISFFFFNFFFLSACCTLYNVERYTSLFFCFLFILFFLFLFSLPYKRVTVNLGDRFASILFLYSLSLSFMVARKTAQIHIFLSIPMLASTRRGSITCSTASFYILFFPIHIPLIFLLICFASFCFVLFCLHFIFLHCVCNVQIQGDTCGYAYVRRPM